MKTERTQRSPPPGHWAPDTLLPAVTAVAMLAALVMVFLVVPTEKHQGVVQRIFYFHVPSAWVAFVAFYGVFAASVAYLWRGSLQRDRQAQAAAEVGMVFCTLVLVTGPIWAKPIWGVWWTWDSRLTTTLTLWLIYAAYLLLRSLGGEGTARFAAILGIIGALDIPIIILSVRWWRTIHPPVLVAGQKGGGLADPRMWGALLVCLVAFTLLAIWLYLLRLRSLTLDDRLASVRRRLEEFSEAV